MVFLIYMKAKSEKKGLGVQICLLPSMRDQKTKLVGILQEKNSNWRRKIHTHTKKIGSGTVVQPS